MSSRSHAYVGTPIGREMEAAIRRINAQQQIAAAVLTEYTPGVPETIAMLFDDEDVAKATAAKGIVIAPHFTTSEYTLDLFGGPQHSTRLGINFDGSYCPPLMAKKCVVNQSRCAPLTAYIKRAEALYLQYEEVKAVLRWLNQNATLNAIRYYFPTAMQLCPETFRGMEMASRHGIPEHIHDWLQPMRDAAATVASAVMLPATAKARDRNKMWLTFESRIVQLSDSKYTTDTITFNI